METDLFPAQNLAGCDGEKAWRGSERRLSVTFRPGVLLDACFIFRTDVWAHPRILLPFASNKNSHTTQQWSPYTFQSTANYVACRGRDGQSQRAISSRNRAPVRGTRQPDPDIEPGQHYPLDAPRTRPHVNSVIDEPGEDHFVASRSHGFWGRLRLTCSEGSRCRSAGCGVVCHKFYSLCSLLKRALFLQGKAICPARTRQYWLTPLDCTQDRANPTAAWDTSGPEIYISNQIQQTGEWRRVDDDHFLPRRLNFLAHLLREMSGAITTRARGTQGRGPQWGLGVAERHL